jgi:hypothetical protein
MSKHHRPRWGPFSEQERTRNAGNTAAEERAREALRENRASMAKTHGKTDKATVKHRAPGYR